MNRPALARSYRPRRFSEIVGQDHVSNTLRTAVERGRVAHAYLFCGPRGVGKTTAARVLAMALNCEDRTDGEPCGACESCTRIWSGRTSLDVVEIDAASNRGVDDARDLRERAMYAPSGTSRYKVYIIDEAHMLTREAWNAFLKILEEPPERVIFVLATTEPGKILQAAPPILSRCQRFDFHRIPVQSIIDRLTEVLESEGVEADEAPLLPLARKADGALRDALSALDQVLAFSGDQISGEDVRQVLGLVDEDLYFELFEILADGRAADVFGYVERLVDAGYDLEEFYKGLGESLRLVLRAGLEGEDGLELVPAHLSDRYAAFADRFAVGDVMRMLSALAELDTDGRFKKSEQQRILIEVLLLKFAMLDRTVELEELIDAATGGGAGGSNPDPSDPGGTGSPPSGGSPGTDTRGGGGGAGGPRGRTRDERASRGEDTERKAGSSGTGERGPAPTGGADAPARPGSPEPRPDSAPAGDPLSAARDAWLAMISEGGVLRPGQGVVLRAVRPTALSPEGQLQVSAPGSGPVTEILEDAVTRRRIEEELSRRLGRGIRLSVESGGGAAERVSEESARRQRLTRLIADDEELGRVVEKMDLELIE